MQPTPTLLRVRLGTLLSPTALASLMFGDTLHMLSLCAARVEFNLEVATLSIDLYGITVYRSCNTNKSSVFSLCLEMELSAI